MFSVHVIEWGASPYKNTNYLSVGTMLYVVPGASAHHGNAEIHMCIIMPVWFANLRSEEVYRATEPYRSA